MKSNLIIHRKVIVYREATENDSSFHRVKTSGVFLMLIHGTMTRESFQLVDISHSNMALVFLSHHLKYGHMISQWDFKGDVARSSIGVPRRSNLQANAPNPAGILGRNSWTEVTNSMVDQGDVTIYSPVLKHGVLENTPFTSVIFLLIFPISKVDFQWPFDSRRVF